MQAEEVKIDVLKQLDIESSNIVIYRIICATIDATIDELLKSRQEITTGNVITLLFKALGAL